MRRLIMTLLCVSGVLFVVAAQAQEKKPKPKQKNPRYADPAKTDNDFPIQGEYTGELMGEDGEKSKYGAHIIAMGDGKFKAVFYPGGLPGDGWSGGDKMDIEELGEWKDGKVFFSNEHGHGEIEDGVLTITGHGTDAELGKELGKLKKVARKSKTLGEKPAQGAVVLFDGKNADNWVNGKMTDDGLLMPGTTSKNKFGSHKVHIEFRLPYMPKDRGQGRGNSGIYLQGKYEVQMLDSFGLEGKNNECGGIYSVKDCDFNMCYPPLAWQTYDIEFTAAKYEGEKLVANPRMTVYHNGVKIHDNVEMPGNRNTTAAPVKVGSAKGPIFLQNHGCPVRYRNIWVVEKQ